MENVNKQLLDALAGYDNIVRIVLNGLRRDYEERGLMIRKEFHDALSSAHAKACEAVFDAKEEMKAIAAAEQTQQAEPVAQQVVLASEHEVKEEWFSAGGFKDAKTGMMVMPERDYFFFRMDIRLHPNVSNQRAFCEVRAKYRQPPAVAVPDERAAFEAWLQENIDDTDTVRPSKEKVDAYFAVWLARAAMEQPK